MLTHKKRVEQFTGFALAALTKLGVPYKVASDVRVTEQGEDETLVEFVSLGLWAIVGSVVRPTIVGPKRLPGYQIGYYKVHAGSRWNPPEEEDVVTDDVQHVVAAVQALAVQYAMLVAEQSCAETDQSARNPEPVGVQEW